jgi:diguanylate cyclase (GGDEF)-like protein
MALDLTSEPLLNCGPDMTEKTVTHDYARFADKSVREVARLRRNEAIYHALLDHFPNGIIVTDQSLNVLVCNKKQRQLLEYPDSMFKDRMPTLPDLFRFNAIRGEYGQGDPDQLFHEKMLLVEKRIAHTFERRRPDGRVLEIRGEPLPNGGFVTTYADITDRRRKEDSLLQAAQRDSLTGLEGRPGLRRHFDMLNDKLKRQASGFAIHCLDLDRFKPINDSYGHVVGDRVLELVSQRLLSTIRETDLAVRLGGDEFAVLQANVQSPMEMQALARRLSKALSLPFSVAHEDRQITLEIAASIGSVMVGEADADLALEALIEKADIGMYQEKKTKLSTKESPRLVHTAT